MSRWNGPAQLVQNAVGSGRQGEEDEVEEVDTQREEDSCEKGQNKKVEQPKDCTKGGGDDETALPRNGCGRRTLRGGTPGNRN